MRLDSRTCWDRLGLAGHGVLGTMHPERGVDAVPVVYVVEDDRIVIPIDTVKAKSGRRLQRLTNIEWDHRCVLLVDHRDEDWSRLWWVRVHGAASEAAPTPAQLRLLGSAFPAYRAAGAVTAVVVVHPTAVTGWDAGPDLA